MTTGNKYLEMSDEDFLKLPELVTGVAEEAAPEAVSEQAPAPVETPAAPEVVEPPVEDQPPVPEKKDEPTPKPVLGEDGKPVEPPKEGEDVPAEEVPINYEELYKRITSPIKANGKEITIKDPEEAIRLMQMGAGYNRKMHEIQPHLKTLRFLEQNNLLSADHSQLAFLVDLHNKNPDAIKKLVKDANIDPLDFNNEEEVNYQTNIAPVTDQQVVFREAIDNLLTQDGGIDTIKVCNSTWDATSHQALMDDPKLLEVIHAQRQNGIYDRIVGEVDRQKALGKIPQSTPFIAAYKQVGDHLQNINGFADLFPEPQRSAEPEVITPPQPQLKDTRVAAPKPTVQNNDKAKAAATPKATPQKAAVTINPLAMSDEDFLKQFGNKY